MSYGRIWLESLPGWFQWPGIVISALLHFLSARFARCATSSHLALFHVLIQSGHATSHPVELFIPILLPDFFELVTPASVLYHHQQKKHQRYSDKFPKPSFIAYNSSRKLKQPLQPQYQHKLKQRINHLSHTCSHSFHFRNNNLSITAFYTTLPTAQPKIQTQPLTMVYSTMDSISSYGPSFSSGVDTGIFGIIAEVEMDI